MNFFRHPAKGMAYALAASMIVGGLAIDFSFAKNENIYDEIQKLDKVLIRVDKDYVEDIPADELVDAAIEGMRTALDPHTAFFKKDDYEDLMVHTKAEFGGLGITIAIRENVLTVVSPLPGTPASMMGILAGDRIVKIDGKSTAGITVEEAVKKLRGKPGTQVTIAIEREGIKERFDYTITRAVIHIKSVPYYGMLNDSVGYLRLVSFSEESGREVEEALKKLTMHKLSAVVFDLRNNPGGLLPAAIDVAGKFLPADRLVVYTRGRMDGQNKEYRTNNKPILDESIPVVVLVNEGSASASEIVSGAIQDWDRGLIVGRQTYGKGSVQTVLPMGLGDDSYLKLTTAYYYTPSGRCINKPENGRHKGKQPVSEDEETAEDTLTAVKDSTAKPDSSAKFFTKGGRVVYGGGGITPDLVIPPERWDRLEEVLERKSLFFKYAVKTISKFKEKNIKIDENYKVTDEMVKDFEKFLATEKVEYSTVSEKALEDLQKSFTQEYGDSSQYKASPAQIAEVKRLIGLLDERIEMEKKHDFERSREYIVRAIKREIIGGILSEDARYRYVLTYDPDVLRGTSIATTEKAKYKALLTAPKK